MNNTSWTKLFSTILTSSIWGADNETRLVWITLLALKDANGYVAAAVPGLANIARVSLDECQRALSILGAPDPYSRSSTNEGRRIQKVEGGWIILNHFHYRDEVCKESAKEYWRRKKKEERDKRQLKKKPKPMPGEMTYVRGVESGTLPPDWAPQEQLAELKKGMDYPHPEIP